MGTPPNKRFNELNNGCACAFWILVHFNNVKWRNSALSRERGPRQLNFKIFISYLSLCCALSFKIVLTVINKVNDFRLSRDSYVKYKIIIHFLLDSLISQSTVHWELTNFCKQVTECLDWYVMVVRHSPNYWLMVDQVLIDKLIEWWYTGIDIILLYGYNSTPALIGRWAGIIFL